MSATRDPIDSMAPWDAVPYFQTPTETTFAVPGRPTITQLCKADPNRVVLIISSSGLASGLVTTKPNPAVNDGISVGGATLPLQWLFSEVAPLCQMAWYANFAGSGFVTVIEVALAKWPRVKVLKGGKRANASRAAQRNRNGR